MAARVKTSALRNSDRHAPPSRCVFYSQRRELKTLKLMQSHDVLYEAILIEHLDEFTSAGSSSSAHCVALWIGEVGDCSSSLQSGKNLSGAGPPSLLLLLTP